MTDETTLRVQAWLDGELPSADVSAVSRLAQTDAGAAQVAQELKLVRSWLAAGEMPRSLPESREFYWSKIQRAIVSHAETKATADGGRLAGWRWLRWVVPAGLAAALAVVWFTSEPSPPQNAGLTSAEIDSPQEDWGTITFRSDSEQMTVVWVGNP
jgi:hypothetical protein